MPKILIQPQVISGDTISECSSKTLKRFGFLTNETLSYFVRSGRLENLAYKPQAGGIAVLRKDGTVCDVTQLSDNAGLMPLTEAVTKHYITYWPA